MTFLDIFLYILKFIMSSNKDVTELNPGSLGNPRNCSECLNFLQQAAAPNIFTGCTSDFLGFFEIFHNRQQPCD